jgi:hypothetical protein
MSEQPASSAPADDLGRLTITIDGVETPARTLAPVFDFNKYVVSFSGGPEAKAAIDPYTSGTAIDLRTGNWTITVTAYKGAAASATGSISKTIVPGNNGAADITLAPVTGGAVQGAFHYDITIPSGLTAATLTITDTSNTDVLSPINLTDGNQSASIGLNAGYYRMNILLSKDSHTMGRTEVIHIYPGLTTSTLVYIFTNADLVTLTGTAAITGVSSPNPLVGETLTADLTGLSSSTGTPGYQWQQDTAGDGTFLDITGETAATYELTDANVSNRIRVAVTRAGYTGNVYSDPTAAVMAQETTPNATIDYANEKLTGLANGDYTINGGGTITVSDGTYSIASLISTSTSVPLSIVKKGNGTTTTDSAAQTSLTLPQRPAAPSVSGGAGTIIGITTAMEYSTSTTGPWTVYTGGTIAVGTYYVRVKQTGSNFVGTVTTGTVGVTADTGTSGLYRDTDLTTAIDLSTTTGATMLAKALKWLDDNPSDSATAYTIILPSGVTESPPNTLSVSTFKSGAKLTLKGIDSTSVIDLRGQGSLFTIAASSNITLVLDENATLKGSSSSNNAALVHVNSSTTFEMKANAKITGNRTSSNGGGVSLNGGTFTMSDNASISGNATYSTYYAGGGVYAINSIFTMSDYASISENTTGSGGGVYVRASTFSMNGNASISENTAAVSGGGAYIWCDSNFTISNFTMQDNASISENTAGYGGGVLVCRSTFNMIDNASISGNIATGSDYGGGGVHVADYGIFTMSGNTSISGNTASLSSFLFEGGGGVYVCAIGTFTKTGGIIYGSDATNGDLKNVVTGRTDKGAAVFVSENTPSSNASDDAHLENTVEAGHDLKVTYDVTATPRQQFSTWSSGAWSVLPTQSGTNWASSVWSDSWVP